MTEEITKPNAELDRLIVEAREITKHTKSEATKRAYARDFRTFSTWCQLVELVPLPAIPETVALYVVHLDNLGRKPATIRRQLSSISQAHRLAGHDSPVNGQVLEVKKGIHRLRGVAQTKKQPLTLEKLRRVVELTPPDFLGYRDRAILLVGWTGALRRSEICDIDLEDLEDQDEGIAINLKRTKTDQEGEGRKIGLPFIDQEHQLCAARALRRWIALAKVGAGAVFLGVGKGGKERFFAEPWATRLEPRAISAIVKRAVTRAGYDPTIYSGHSLRSGLATTLAHCGIEERRIQEITGHRSLSMLREYIHQGSLFVDHPVVSLFSTQSLSD
jgi:integrase